MIEIGAGIGKWLSINQILRFDGRFFLFRLKRRGYVVPERSVLDTCIPTCTFIFDTVSKNLIHLEANYKSYERNENPCCSRRKEETS